MIPLLLFIGLKFEHHSGQIYELLMVTNQFTTDTIKFPLTAVYRNIESGYIWSRPVKDFIQNFTLIG